VIEPGGLLARTEFQVLHRFPDDTTLLEAFPITGRTNQIRVHLWDLGFPVCGDPIYLRDRRLGTVQTLGLSDSPLCLHAWRIEFTHPLSSHRVKFTAPPPAWAERG
jgi:23S rRNA-/tRNA-specific pseudouridylate synthase